jgi:hypothetical protein
MKAWNSEELSLLAKAIARFPPGVTDRWQKIADLIGTRSVKEVITKANETKYGTKADAIYLFCLWR